ncbi:MAG: pyridoxal phosphate-dependent aminotransferase [Nocardioides sp.]|nr:pyridoxal phosphate-dependent aminotransferase [Nocardioidaceae bacterium]MCB8957178.1 pyridoxal phosphate-dependent aminotransferase [Nocardioides sp.]
MAAHRRLAHRLDGIPPTIFTAMSALAVRTQSVNLGQGFPDVDGPPEVVAQAVHALETGQNQYAPGPGVPALRQAVARHQLRHYGLELDPDCQVVVTTGCTEAIAAALLGLVDPGDEVVVLEPYYDSYTAMIQMAGGVRRPVTLRAPGIGDEHSRLDVDELRAAVTPRTRFVLLNSPHNPTGTVLTPGELQAVADVALEHDLVVITDEVYEHLVFDGSEHVPIATLPGMFERTLTLSSVGKSYSFTGWKVGWATGPADLVGAVLAAKQWLTFTSGSPLQPAVAHALDEQADYPARLAADLQAKRDLLCGGLAGIGLDVRVPEGTYFATTDISALGWPDSTAFCLALPERAGVVAVPLAGFYDSDAGRHLVRWAFCKEASVIEEGLGRLAAADLACS